MSCSQLVEIEDLVLGTITAVRARALRAHVDGCPPCRAEHAQVTRERALFTQRARLVPPPLAPELIFRSLRARRPPFVVRVLRHGQLYAACTALLFGLVALSRLGGAPALPIASADENSGASGAARSSMSRDPMASEPLTCSVGDPGMALSCVDARGSTVPMSVAAVAVASESPELLACGRYGEGFCAAR